MIRCSNCGSEQWGEAAATRTGAAIRCGRCRSVATIRGASVLVDGIRVERDGQPGSLLALSVDPADPWVVLEVRLVASAREVVERAIARVCDELSVTAGRAIELIAADYLAGA